MLNPVAMSIITNTFTDKTERARAIGAWAARTACRCRSGRLPTGCIIRGGPGYPLVIPPRAQAC